MLLRNVKKRIKHLESEIAAGDKHDGWTLKGLKKELKDVVEAAKELGNQVGDVGKAVKGKKRQGRKAKK